MRLVVTNTLLLAMLLLPGRSNAEPATYSFQWRALTANAGGQKAYALRRGTDAGEWSLFGNEYLKAGGYPLIGGSYDWRFPICGQSCFWQFYTQVGIGLSTGGPFASVLLGSIALWSARLDFATHIYVTRKRFITWNYPAWIGISIPLWF